MITNKVTGKRKAKPNGEEPTARNNYNFTANKLLN